MKNHITVLSITLKAALMEKSSTIPTPHESRGSSEVLCEQLFVGEVSWLQFLCLFLLSLRQPSTPSGPFTPLCSVGVVLFGHCMSDLYILLSLRVSLICFSKECLKKTNSFSARSLIFVSGGCGGFHISGLVLNVSCTSIKRIRCSDS